MSDVIKVNHLENDIVKKIYVFAGKRDIEEDYPWNLTNGTPVFSTEELDKIREDGIAVVIVDGYLHGDDTIATIKKKIVKYTKLRVSAKELYLFAIRTETINPAILYNQLTQNDTYKLSGQRLCQFLLNIVNPNCNEVNTKCPLEQRDSGIYDFEDMMTIDGIAWDAPLSYTIPIGQKLVIKKRYPFIANPYNCLIMDEVLRSKSSTIISTQNSNLLFEYNHLCNNTIFICLAEEVLTFADSLPDISQSEFSNLYFPNLVLKDGITSLDQLKSQKIALYDEQRKLLDNKFNMYNSRVDLLYDIYYKRTSGLDYTDNSPGILKTEFIIHPRYPMKMPLEMLFKLINSTKEVPMVKYNPGRERENIYRLFTADNKATNGKEIPYLYTNNHNKKGKIIRLSKLLARKKRVAYYIEYTYLGIDFEIDCEFEINGNINVTVKHSGIIKQQVLETAVKNALNEPVLIKVKHFLEQSGYIFQTFQSFDQDNIEFKDITFISMLEIKKNIKLNSYTGCLSSVFTILDDKLSSQKNELRLKYKRVSNYNELDSIDSFINEMRRNEEEPDAIIKKLNQNFNLDEIEARARFAAWASQINVETDLFENKAITIRTNTGFPITIVRDSTNFITSIKTTNINDIGYLRFINIYIDSLLRLLTDKKSTGVSGASITSLCKGKTIVEVIPEKDIVTHRIRFEGDREKMSTFLDIFGEQDVSPTSLHKGTKDIDFEDVEFGEIGEDESPGGDIIDFEGVEFGEIGEEESKHSTQEEEDFGDVDFGDIGDISLQEEGHASQEASELETKQHRSLSEHGRLEQSPEIKSAEISPQSDITSDAEVDLEGIQLRGTNNIFMKKKEKLQPDLFLKKEQGRYKAYSRLCPSQYAKQPIILDDKELDYINAEDRESNTKSYDEKITYAYGPGSKKYHYICPRYWCLSDKNGKQRSLSLKEINDGACGGWDALVPDGSTHVPAGKRIVEFTDDRFHKSKVKTSNRLVYKPMFPSFMGNGKHPDGLCVPCCFTRPTHFDPKNTKWILRQNKKGKNEYYNTETKEISKYPLIEYDDMYKPIGKGTGGPGPSYKTDDMGNIIMDSIKGEKEIREAPAGAREKTFAECDQSGQAKAPTKEKSVRVDYTVLLEAWPLKPGQVGFLPLSVQKFLGYNSREICQASSSESSAIKENQPCLLHKGVEESDRQSFLSCIADIYSEAVHEGDPKSVITKRRRGISITIAELKKKITSQLTIDNFVTLQNGDLVNVFSDMNDVIDIAPFKQSKLYKSLNKSQESTIYFQKVISAFINFKKYILDDRITIDYKYLWDYISQSMTEDGSGLFPEGINMIIMRSPEDDVTSKIELICPVNHYASQPYDLNKKTLILYSRNGYFEPIYKYIKIKSGDWEVEKLFDIRNIMRELPEIGNIINHIWSDLITKCKPLPSMPAEYNFQENIDFLNILEILRAHNSTFKLYKQVANYNSQVIGLLLSKGDDRTKTIYLPCRPSAINNDYPLTFIGEATIWNSYKKTLRYLRDLKDSSSGELLSAPRMKLVNEGIIVGIITETNQLVPTVPEVYQAPPHGEEESDGLVAIIKDISPDSFNYLDLDNKLLTEETVDKERIKKVRDIRLESHFYNVFRNMLRIVLAYYENKDVKDSILHTIQSPIIPYYEKLQTVEKHITDILKNYVIFTEFTDSVLENIGKIELCLNISDDKCAQKKYCSFTADVDGKGRCKLLLPRNNLISGGNNAIQYFARIANELITFDRIRTFIFVPKTFLSFQNVSYNLHSDEIILLEDLLYGDYFEDIIPREINPYISNTSNWNTAEPAVSFPYANIFNIPSTLQDIAVNPCIVTESQNKKLVLGTWREQGLQEYNIDEFRPSTNCSWEMIKDILNIHRPGEKHTISSIVTTLVGIYNNLSKTEQFTKVLSIMNTQGKRDQARAIASDVPIPDIITQTNYYLTSIDFLLLADAYEIPLILLCRTKIPTLFSQYISFIKNEPEACYIIFAGGYPNADSKQSPIYGLLSKGQSTQLSVIDLGDVFTKITGLNITTLDAFIERTVLAKKIAKALIKRRKTKIKVVGKPLVKKIKTKVRLG